MAPGVERTVLASVGLFPLPNATLQRIFGKLAEEYRRRAIREVPRARLCEPCRLLLEVGELHTCP